MTITRKKPSEFYQFVAAIIGTITSIGYGSAMTWTSPAIPYLMSENSHLPVTKEQSDKISSLLTVGYIIGYVINPFIIEQLGRKRTLLFYTLPQSTSWILILFAKNHMTIYVARILSGIGYGAGICALTIYLSEIGSTRTRGIFIAFLNLSMGLGFFFAMLLGAFLSYNYMNLIFLATPIIFAVTFFFMPDSSYFMEKANRQDQEMKEKLSSSAAEMDKLKLEEENVNKDFNLKEKEHSSLSDNEYSSFCVLKESSLWKLLTFPNSQKGLIIVVSLAALDVFSGHMVLWTFTQQLFTYKGSYIDPEKATLIIAFAKIAAAAISAHIIEKTGRRVLILSTGIIGTISHALVGIFFFFEERNVDISSFNWLPIFGLAIYELSFAIGAANFFYLFQAELFSTEVKSMAVMVCKVSYMVFSYFCLFRFQVLLEAVGKSMIFLLFTICAGFGTVFVFCITPETRGKNIDEIQVILRRKKFFV